MSTPTRYELSAPRPHSRCVVAACRIAARPWPIRGEMVDLCAAHRPSLSPPARKALPTGGPSSRAIGAEYDDSLGHRDDCERRAQIAEERDRAEGRYW